MSNTYIVDGNSLLFRSYWSTAYTGNIMTTSTGIPVNAIFAFHNLIRKIKANLTDGDHLFVSFDTGKPTLRKKEFEDYKAQRAPVPQELIAQMPIAREMLTAMNIHWDEQEGYEGDDLAGSMAKVAVSHGDNVTLFTSDKDFLQLLDLSENVHVCFLKKGLSETVDYTKNNLHELFGLNPDQIADFKGIAGDPSDNYKGIKGIGEKTAMKLLNEHGHLEDILQYCKENNASKTNQKFIEGEEDALFFKKLATIDTEMDMNENYQKSLYQHYQKSLLAPFYLKYQMQQFLNKIDRMEGILNDSESHQMSLFDGGDNVQMEEAKNSSFIERPLIKVKAFNEIKEPIKVIAYDADNENENLSVLLGFALASDKNVYYIYHEDASKDKDFASFLCDASHQLSCYDLKGLSVLLSRFGYPQIAGVDFDLLLATYLINPDSGQKKANIFLAYGVDLDTTKNQAVQTASYTLDLKNQISEDLKKNGEMELFQDVEMPLSLVLAKMEIEGFPIDLPTLKTINGEYNQILDELEKAIYRLAGEEFNINSPKQLETILFEKLGIHRYKGEKGTGIDVLLSHQDDHAIVPRIIEYRLYKKLVSGYTSSLPEHTGKDGKIHAIYNQALTSTGRLSMSEPNLQNISIRNEEGKAIRKAFFYPDHEFYLLSLDYSQVELRVLASVGDIKVLQEIFREGQDIHRATASRVFNVPFDEVTPEMRRRAKAVNFGIVYGISPFGLANQLDIPLNEASDLIRQFKDTFDGLDAFQNRCIEKARNEGYVSTLLNRRRYLKDINSKNRALRSFNERAAVNTVIQGTAADLIKVAMVKADKLLEKYKTKIVLQIHDELLFKVPKDELETILPLLKETMEHALDLSVPLKADGAAALDWYDAH